MISVRHFQNEYCRKASFLHDGQLRGFVYQGSGTVSQNLRNCDIDWMSMSFSSLDYACEMAELLKSATTLAEEWNKDAGKPASEVLSGSALTHVCDTDSLRERITHQYSMLMRIYENARGDGDSAHAVTRWEIDTVDYQALEAFLFPDDADKTSAVLGGKGSDV